MTKRVIGSHTSFLILIYTSLVEAHRRRGIGTLMERVDRKRGFRSESEIELTFRQWRFDALTLFENKLDNCITITQI